MPLTTRRTSKPSVSILCRPVSRIRAEICTPPARLAVGATTKVSVGCLEPRLLGHPCGHLVGGQGPALEHEHAAARLLLVAELVEQLMLHPGVCPQGAGSHREELADRDRPARVLGGHAGDRGMIGPHHDSRPGCSTDLKRGVADVPRPPMQISLRTRPAPNPPGISTPASMTRAPPGNVESLTRRRSSCPAMRSAISHASSFILSLSPVITVSMRESPRHPARRGRRCSAGTSRSVAPG